MKAANLWLSSPKSAFRFGLVAVSFAALIPYSAVYSFEYVLWDDNVYLIERPEIHGGVTGDGIKWAFTTFQNANWHPLTWLSYMLEIELFGLDSGRVLLNINQKPQFVQRTVLSSFTPVLSKMETDASVPEF